MEELEFWDDFQEKQGEIKYVLRPFDDNITLEKRLIKQEDYIPSLNSISSTKNLNIDTRAKLINFVIRNVSINEGYKLWLFIDDNNNLINDAATMRYGGRRCKCSTRIKKCGGKK